MQTRANTRLRLVLAGIAVLVWLIASSVQPTWARKPESRLRTVHGTVVDSSDNPLGTAVVYLKNRKTLSVRTYISDAAGHYRFSGLDPNVDYEIHAEHEQLTSATRTISSLDDRKDIVIILKVHKKKPSR